jgi:cobalamin biosynthesis Mg chelatase CobN
MLFFRLFPNLKRTNLVPEPSNKPFSLMKHLFNTLSKLAAVAVVGLSISSCNRAEYAMLPKTTPYHATYGNVVKVEPAAPTTQDAAVVAKPATPQVEKSVAVEAPAPAATAKVATAPAASRSAHVAHSATSDVAPRKMSVPQRALLAKVSKKVDKLASKAQSMKSKETASHEETNALSRNIKVGIILILIGLLLGIFGGVIGVVGGIIALVGVVLIILGLLDEL